MLIITNNPETLVSHRLPVALAARDNGYEVHIATPPGEDVARITEHGLHHHPLPLSRGGMNPLIEFLSLVAFIRLFLRLRPDIVHLVTIKPLLYGGIAARLTGVRGVVSAVAGLGYIFTADSTRARWLRRLVVPVYRWALGHPNQYVIFQNESDRETLRRLSIVRSGRTELIHGSGVDLTHYPYRDEPDSEPVVVLASRLLRDKGIHEFREAAIILYKRGIKARFQLAGAPDPGNPNRVTREELDAWRAEGHLEVLGFRSDIPELFADSHIVTLPSFYGEGLPKVLIEAAACGRAVVTTDTPGSRDAIVPDQTGSLVPPRDSRALADALERLISDDELRRELGRQGRILAEQRFRIETVIEQHLALYQALLESREKER